MSNEPSDGLFPSWLLWVIAPITVLAAGIIILSLVLGIQAGQRQVELQRRQQVGIAIQRAMDFRTEGMLEESLAEYQRVLTLDPGNAAAVTGIESLLQMASEGVASSELHSVTSASVEGEAQPSNAAENAVGALAQTNAPTVAPTVAPTSAPEEQQWSKALLAYEAGDWKAAESALLQLKSMSPNFLSSEVEETLYNTYVNMAAQLDQDGELEQALAYVDKALVLHPDETELRDARELASDYLDVLTVSGADWERAIEMLESLYVRNPGYRDVTDRLREAHIALGDILAEDKEWCTAAAQYRSAVAIASTADSITRRNTLEERCDATKAAGGGSLALLDDSWSISPTEEPDSDSTSSSTDIGLPNIDAAVDATADATGAALEDEPTSLPGPSLETLSGRIVYSAKDPIQNQINVFIKEIGSTTPAQLLIENAQQAEFRPDGTRFAFRNLRDDQRGISSLDPDSGLTLRFTDYAEDSRPSWNGEGNRIAFSSNREGDRIWRVYSLWADVDNEPQLLAYGDSPSWSRATDRIAYRGCDDSGNQCGIWLMNGSGGDRGPLTTTPSDDQPDWSPDGAFLAFMSDGRDGNPEVYRANIADRSVTRLTNNGSIDGLPVVSPDGKWVAFVSNRSGSWAVYATPSTGGEAQAVFTISGSLDAWHEHNLQWLP